MNNKSRSNSLLHFTKSIDNLKSIMENGLYPSYCLEDIAWINFIQEKFMSHPMVCFCDIPIGRIGQHTGYYGKFGLGFTKEWAEKNKIFPVYYTPNNSPIKELASFIDRQFVIEMDRDDVLAMKLHEKLFKIMSSSKPMSGLINDKEKNFYEEVEWRYIAPTDSIFKENFDDKDFLATQNKKAREFSLQFSPSDIRYIFVENDSDIKLIVKFIKESLSNKFETDEIDELITKITSLQRISEDF